jgi:hypothetical protein
MPSVYARVTGEVSTGGETIDSYSNALIKFVLTHYLDIVYCKITPEQMQDFTRSAGRHNPLETALIWKADVDLALVSLSKTHHGWEDALKDGMSDSMILHLSRSKHLSTMQREIVSNCILRDCNTDCNKTRKGGPCTCWSEPVISRMRRYLNGKFTPYKYREVQANALTPVK